MTTNDLGAKGPTPVETERGLSLYQLLDPLVLADPYDLYRRLRESDPVHWDPFLHTWVATRYDDVMTVLQTYSAQRALEPSRLTALGLGVLAPVGEVMVRQMLFLDPPQHTRVRTQVARSFTPPKVEILRDHIAGIIDRLLDAVHAAGSMDVIADLARPLPAIVSCEMLGLPAADWSRLSTWTMSYASLLGNFQDVPVQAGPVRETVDAMTGYFRRMVRMQSERGDGFLFALGTAGIDGEALDEDDIVANAIITLVGSLETTTNLIGNGLFSLLARPDQWELLKQQPELVPGAVEELLRFESPIQHTARIAPTDTELAGRPIRAGQSVTAVIGAANRDPERFADPDTLDIRRENNRHLGFGWSLHHCFGAPLARLEGQLAFAAIVERLGSAHVSDAPVRWRTRAGAFRGLESLPIEF